MKQITYFIKRLLDIVADGLITSCMYVCETTKRRLIKSFSLSALSLDVGWTVFFFFKKKLYRKDGYGARNIIKKRRQPKSLLLFKMCALRDFNMNFQVNNILIFMISIRTFIISVGKSLLFFINTLKWLLLSQLLLKHFYLSPEVFVTNCYFFQ